MPHTWRSPLFHAYGREKPCVPNLRRPRQSEWKKESAKSMGLNGTCLVDLSKVACEKSDHAPRRSDLTSVGGSQATLMADCMMPSGMSIWSGRPGGSAVTKQRKSTWPCSVAISSLRSRMGSQACIRWTFCRKAQPPSMVKRSRTFSPFFSWPCPMEMESTAFLRFLASSTMGPVGSAPMESSAMTGTLKLASSVVVRRSSGRESQ
mmetsp:Transcript_9663/g.23020  ORF Transcript_9663/g.23020 Transcript_9663/m.23020 type:complete len:206 (+) Transcript_9663:380-997(+)